MSAHANPLTPDRSTPDAGSGVPTPAELDVRRIADQMAQMAGMLQALQAQVAQFPIILAKQVATALAAKSAVTPCTKVTVRQLSPMMPANRRSPVTIRRYAKRKTIPGEKVGHHWLFEPAEVMAALATDNGKAAVRAVLAKRPYTRRKPLASENTPQPPVGESPEKRAA